MIIASWSEFSVQNWRANRVIRHPTTFCGSQTSTILSRILSLSLPPSPAQVFLFCCIFLLPFLFCFIVRSFTQYSVLEPSSLLLLILSSPPPVATALLPQKNQGVLHTPLPNRIFLDLAAISSLPPTLL